MVRPEKIKLLHQFMCYLILILIVSYISMMYFKYATDTNVAPYTPIRQELPIFSLCFDLATLLYENTTKYFFSRTNYPIYASLTTGEIFEKSPPTTKLLKRCAYRLFDTDTLWTNFNSTECNILFNAKRYRMQGYMCYKMQFARTDYSFYLTTHSIFDQRRLFSFVLRPPFDQGHVILPIIHFDDLPFHERLADQEIIPPLKQGQAYVTSYHLYEINKLPPPYVTRCCSRHQGKSGCFNRCRDVGYAELNFTSHYSITPEEGANKQLKVALFTSPAGESIVKKFIEVKSNCLEKCRFDPCEQKLAITHVAPPSKGNGISFTVETAQFPVTKVLHKAKLRFPEFLLQCFSWAGICIGFSILNTLVTRKIRPRARKVSCSQFNRQTLNIELDVIQLANLLHEKGFHRRQETKPGPQELPKKDERKRRVTVILVSWTLMTFVFLLWQLYNVTTNYFLFETTWKFAHHMEYKLNLPNTAVCTPLDDHFGLRSEKYVDLYKTNYHQVTTSRDQKLNYTLEELFVLSWNESILSKCRVWDQHKYQLVLRTLDRQDCLGHFRIQKFISTGGICYIFKPQQPPDHLDIWRVKLNPFRPGVMYSLIPNEKLTKNSYTQLIVYFGEKPPHLSQQHSVVAIRMLEKRIQFLTFHLFYVRLLPPPYNTWCLHSVVNKCNSDCYLDSLDQIDRLSLGQAYTFPYKQRMLSYTDLTNSSVNDYWVALEKKCYKKCWRTSCHFNYTSTSISYPMDRSQFLAEYTVTSSPGPVTEQVAIARMTFYEFCYEIFCCFSFWLGFSLATLGPRAKSQMTMTEYLAERRLKRLLVLVNSLSDFATRHNSLSKRLRYSIYHSRVKKVLPCILCIAGCLLHLSTSLEYFKYPIILDTVRQLDTETSYTFTICLDGYNFFMKKASFRRNVMRETHEFHMLRSKMLNLSIEDIFRRTPDEKNLISFCRKWGVEDENRTVNDLSLASDRLMLMETNGSRCHEFFRTEKFIMQTKICYSFTPKIKLKWNRHQMYNVLSFDFFKDFYMLSFNSSFITKRFSVIVTPENTFHGFSSIWSPGVVETYPFSTWHVVSYTKYIQKVLPPPYSDEGFTHILHMKCIDLCINGKLASNNKSLTSIFYHPDNRKLVTFADRVANRTFNDWINRRLQQCESGCKYGTMFNQESETEFTVTDIDAGRRSMTTTFTQGSTVTSFYLRGTADPVCVILFKAKISFFQFLITIGSIISIWFGLSSKNIPQTFLAQRVMSSTELIHELRLKFKLLETFVEEQLPMKP